jgi:LDH2 family malate/lactate/ureidoglycolate dehydrogenase
VTETPVAFDRLVAFATEALTALGAHPDHARITAQRLLEGDLRGRSGHGIIRLPPYATRIRAGGYNLDPDVRLLHETPVSAVVDGDNGLGQVTMTRAAETAIAKAAEIGMAWVGTRHGNHAGAAGVYTAMATRASLISFYMAVGSANTMPPWGGRDQLLGTNPIAIGIPAAGGPPFELDIATTVTSHGTIKVYGLQGRPLPEGWAMDYEGNPITDPHRVSEGFLLPIGGHKGYGLNVAIGLLAGALNGAAFTHQVIDHRSDATTPANAGQAMFVMRPDLFGDTHTIEAEIRHHLDVLKHSAPLPGREIAIPGEHAAAREERLRRDGIPLPEKLLGDLRRLGEELGLTDRLEAS